MSQRVYEVEESEYVTRYKEINLEDVGEIFVTQDELEEADNKYARSIWKVPLIKRHVTKAVKSIPENKKSIPISNELWNAIREGTGWQYEDELKKKGIRAERGRVYKSLPEQKQIRKGDFISLRRRVYDILHSRGVDATFGINHGQCKMKLINHFKKICTWKEIAAEEDSWYDQKSPDGLKLWIRKMWLDPTLMEGK